MPEEKKENTATPVEKMPEQNGVRQPRPGTNCAKIWDLAAKMSDERNAPVAVGDLLEVAEAQGFAAATVKTQYARWRKFHGIEGRVESDKARQKKEAAAQAKAAKEAEKAEKKAAREAAKAAKEAEKAEKAAAKEAEKKAKAEEAAAKKAAAEAKKAAEKAKKEAAQEADAE